MEIKRLLVVAAHPDDEVLGCAGTIARVKDLGGCVRVLVMGEGSSARFTIEDIEKKSKLIEVAKQSRKENFYAAMKFLQVDEAEIWAGICGRFDTQPLIDFAKKVEEVILEFEPDTLMTHSAVDVNNDHQIINKSVLIATRPTPGSLVKTVLFFEILSSSEWRFQEIFTPSVFIDISSYSKIKLKAFEFYEKTEGRPFPFPRSPAAINTAMKYRGAQVGVSAAEAFELCRTIV